MQQPFQMPQGLDARDHLDPQVKGIVVDFPQLPFAVAATHIPEIGLSLHLVGVLRVQHEHIQPHGRHITQQSLGAVDRQNVIAGTIRHHAVGAKAAALPHGSRFFSFQHPPEETQPAEQGGLTVVKDFGPLAVPAHLQALAAVSQRDGDTLVPLRIRERFLQTAQSVLNRRRTPDKTEFFYTSHDTSP